jgi:hypothetical protein
MHNYSTTSSTEGSKYNKFFILTTVDGEYNEATESIHPFKNYEDLMISVARAKLSLGYGHCILKVEPWVEKVDEESGLKERYELPFDMDEVDKYKQKAIERRKEEMENRKLNNEAKMRSMYERLKKRFEVADQCT